jgi:hypothetical protein
MNFKDWLMSLALSTMYDVLKFVFLKLALNADLKKDNRFDSSPGYY